MPLTHEPSRLTRLLMFGALVAIGPLTIDIYLAAFPTIVTDLETTDAAVQLTLTATLIGLAIIVSIFRTRGSASLDDVNLLKN